MKLISPLKSVCKYFSLVLVFVLPSCTMEKVELYDFSCYVNGQLWQMDNPTLVLSRYSYRIVASRARFDSAGISINAYPDEGKEVILTALSLDINEFHGVGKYDKDRLNVSGQAVARVENGFKYISTYHIDRSKPYTIFIESYELDSGATRGSIRGIFAGTLKADNGPDGKAPEFISITSGRFACPVRVWL